MNISLKSKTAIICGSTQGIGLAIAKEFAQSGAHCVLLARNEIALKEAIQSLPKEGDQQHLYLVADFINPTELKKVITIFMSAHRVHILVNNTGGPAGGPIMDAEEDAFINTFNQHLVCNHILTKAIVPSMKKEGYGRIINIISTSVRIPLKNLGVSNTIRGAVASWSKSMANELGQFNITVNNILPGATKTSRLENIIKTNASKQQLHIEEIEQEMLKEIPMNRFGEPEEIAALATFLASPAASYISGVSIPVDGGRTGSI